MGVGVGTYGAPLVGKHRMRILIGTIPSDVLLSSPSKSRFKLNAASQWQRFLRDFQAHLVEALAR